MKEDAEQLAKLLANLLNKSLCFPLTNITTAIIVQLISFGAVYFQEILFSFRVSEGRNKPQHLCLITYLITTSITHYVNAPF